MPDDWVALVALRGDRTVQQTVQQIAAKHRLHPTQVTSWKRQAIDGLTGVFSDKVKRVENNEAEVKDLHDPLTDSGLLANHER